MKLSKHVATFEVTCRCKGQSTGPLCEGVDVPVPSVLKLFELIRAYCCQKAGRETPITIGSGVRCERWNRIVGGAEDSRHLPKYRDALDLRKPTALSLEEFHAICDALNPRGGVGFYPWGCHVDTRGTKARWGEKA